MLSMALRNLSMALTRSIYGTYKVYLWYLQGLSMVLTDGNLATGQVVSIILYHINYINNYNYFFPARA